MRPSVIASEASRPSACAVHSPARPVSTCQGLIACPRRKKAPLGVGGIRGPASVDEDLLLRDRLHPNTAGLAGVTCRLAELLVKQELAPAHALDLDPRKLHMALEELTAERLEERRRIRREKLREPRGEHVERGSSGGR